MHPHEPDPMGVWRRDPLGDVPVGLARALADSQIPGRAAG